MNPLTLVKRIQSINSKEAELGISDDASWHAKYKDSAYVFTGGIPYDLTEGDLLAVFAQYGEIVDVNLVRDKATGKSKGFAFIAYEDQRSTTLAVDNLNGASIGGRIIRVDHVAKYKKKEEEDEETERLKREERGVCRAFQKGECKYGDSCKFSHDEQRAADTGWGHEEDKSSKWGNDKYGIPRDNKRLRDVPPSHGSDRKQPDGKSYRGKNNIETTHRPSGDDSTDPRNTRDMGKRSEYREDYDKRTIERRSSRYESESKSRDDNERRDEKKSRRHDSLSSISDSRDGKYKDRDRVRDRDRDMDRDSRERNRDEDKRSSYARDSSPQRHRHRDEDDRHRARRDESYKSRR